MENQMDSRMEHEMWTRVPQGYGKKMDTAVFKV